MQLERGNMWSIFFDTDIFMITTNPIIKKDGGVVMGRGIALEAKTRFPDLPYDFGDELKISQNYQEEPRVGYINTYEQTQIWYFMVKEHWAAPASTEIIHESVQKLNWYHNKRYNEWQNIRIDLNFPGIGNGGLPREQVLPLLLNLPDNVHIWEYA